MGRGGKAEEAEDAATAAGRAAREEREARRRGVAPAGLDPVEFGPDEADAVVLFLSLGSQWRLHAMSGVRTGLEYTAVPATAAMMGITVTPELFQDLRVMEGAALAAWAGA